MIFSVLMDRTRQNLSNGTLNDVIQAFLHNSKGVSISNPSDRGQKKIAITVVFIVKQQIKFQIACIFPALSKSGFIFSLRRLVPEIASAGRSPFRARRAR